MVLTTDRTLASDYHGNVFIGFAATFPKILPEFLYSSLLAPPLPHEEGIMKYGHCGSRKIEASLLRDGFNSEEVVIGHPDHLDKLLGPNTKALAITTHDPLGLGPASTTFSSFVRGEPYSAHYFKKLVRNPLLKKYKVKVIVGGPGIWQLDDNRIMKMYHIDTIVLGEGEKVAPELFRKALNDEKMSKKVKGKLVKTEEIPNVQGPTINGLVEISRGCGRGCDFCAPTLLNLRHRPVEDILEEVRKNTENGGDKIILHAEDVLRYGSQDMNPKPQELMSLLKKTRGYTGDIFFSHFALASVVVKPHLIEEISELLHIGSRDHPWFSAQTGLETGSSKLASRHLKGKAKPYAAEEWPSVVRNAFEILADNNWVPCVTVIMGLPGETSQDVMKTMELIDDLSGKDFFIVPLMFVPLGASQGEDFFSREDMTSAHWQLLAQCIKNDFEVTPKLLKDMRDIGPFRKLGYHLLIKYMKNRLTPYVAEMEKGRDPARCL